MQLGIGADEGHESLWMKWRSAGEPEPGSVPWFDDVFFARRVDPFLCDGTGVVRSNDFVDESGLTCLAG